MYRKAKDINHQLAYPLELQKVQLNHPQFPTKSTVSIKPVQVQKTHIKTQAHNKSPKMIPNPQTSTSSFQYPMIPSQLEHPLRCHAYSMTVALVNGGSGHHARPNVSSQLMVAVCLVQWWNCLKPYNNKPPGTWTPAEWASGLGRTRPKQPWHSLCHTKVCFQSSLSQRSAFMACVQHRVFFVLELKNAQDKIRCDCVWVPKTWTFDRSDVWWSKNPFWEATNNHPPLCRRIFLEVHS